MCILSRLKFLQVNQEKIPYTEGESNPCRLLIQVRMEGKHDNHFTIGV